MCYVYKAIFWAGVDVLSFRGGDVEGHFSCTVIDGQGEGSRVVGVGSDDFSRA